MIPTNCGKQGKQEQVFGSYETGTMTPVSNISLNKILEKIPCMFMKQNYGHVFQLVKRCYVLIGIRHYELNGEVSNIVAHGKKKEQMCQGSCSVGFSLYHMSLKIGAPYVESNFMCRGL